VGGPGETRRHQERGKRWISTVCGAAHLIGVVKCGDWGGKRKVQGDGCAKGERKKGSFRESGKVLSSVRIEEDH